MLAAQRTRVVTCARNAWPRLPHRSSGLWVRVGRGRLPSARSRHTAGPPERHRTGHRRRLCYEVAHGISLVDDAALRDVGPGEVVADATNSGLVPLHEHSPGRAARQGLYTPAA